MIVLKPPVEKQELVFGDYVSVHVQGDSESPLRSNVSPDNLIRHEELFQRVIRQRGEVKPVNPVQDIVMNVDNRHRGILPNTLPRRRAG